MPEAEEAQNLNFNETLRQVTGFIVRWRWWVLLPLGAVMLVTAAILWVLPNRYTSRATLLVVQQRVSERYVVPNSTTEIGAVLEAMKQQVLSRTQLLRIINEFDLYSRSKHLAPEQLVALILRDIDIVPIKGDTNQKLDAFQISFTTESPVVAQKVTTTLTHLFINEYLRNGEEHATSTTSFLHEQVMQKAQELRAQEERLRDFKLQYSGELPEQQQGNLGILTGLQGQLQNTMANLNRAQQQRAFLQAQIEAMSNRSTVRTTTGPRVIVPGSLAPIQMTALEAAETELARLQTERSALLGKGFGPQHPDVVANKAEMEDAENAVKRLRAAQAAALERSRASAAAGTSAAEAEAAAENDDPALVQLKSSLEANRLEIENLTNEETRLKTSIAQYENRINVTPVREQQQAGMVRTTEALRLEYADLLKKEQESQLATNLEKEQGGQQFRLVDSASLPVVPSSPKRFKLSLGGAGLGLFLGLGLAAFMQMRDTSFHTQGEVTKLLMPPFVVSIPPLLTPAEERRQRWQRVLEWSAGVAMFLVVSVADFYVIMRRGS